MEPKPVEVQSFLMIHGMGRGVPLMTYPDDTQGQTEARNEAIRLARTNPGFKYVILRSVGGFYVPIPEPPPVHRIEIIEPLPF